MSRTGQPIAHNGISTSGCGSRTAALKELLRGQANMTEADPQFPEPWANPFAEYAFHAASTFVERLTRWSGPLGDEDAWEEIMRAASAVGQRGDKIRPKSDPPETPVKPPPFRLADFGASPGFRRSLRNEQLNHFRGLIRAASIQCTGLAKGVLVTREGFTTTNVMSEAILFTNGNVRIDVGLVNSILVVDGEVVIRGSIRKVADGKLPARAGLKVGDLITAVDAGKVDSMETFRKLVRRGSIHERCTLSVKRGDMNLDVILEFRAEERAKEKTKPPDKK